LLDNTGSMKFIISVLKQHFRDDFSRKGVVVSLLIAAILILAESVFKVNERITNEHSYTFIIYLWDFLRNAFVYYGSTAVLSATGIFHVENKKRFVAVSLVGIILFSIYSVFYGYIYAVSNAPYPCRLWLHSICENISGIFTLFLPLLLFWYFFQRREVNGFYGLHFRNLQFVRYADVILLVVICMFFAMFLPGVSEYYPVLNDTYYRNCANYIGLSQWVTATGFEISYLFDFVWIELFFRGFLVFGMVKFLGKNVILPMIVLYVVIHFGKPLPEIISSFFGGYLLGILALHTGNIRTGILLHITLALSAEVFGMLL